MTEGAGSEARSRQDAAATLDLRPVLAELRIADDPERWHALGFAVSDGRAQIGGVRISLGANGTGIVEWSLRGLRPTGAIDGLRTTVAGEAVPHPGTAHPNGASAIDHVVVTTPDFDRTAAALASAGLALRRFANNRGLRMGFRRLGPAVLELVETPSAEIGPARFWGLAIMVADLDSLAVELSGSLGAIRPAVQPGQRIATLMAVAGLTPRVAFMDATADDPNEPRC